MFSVLQESCNTDFYHVNTAYVRCRISQDFESQGYLKTDVQMRTSTFIAHYQHVSAVPFWRIYC